MPNLSAVAREIGISRSGLDHRLRRGMTLDKAIAAPVKKYTNLNAHARARGVNISTAWRRMQNGASLEQAVTNVLRCEGCKRDYNEFMCGDHDHTTGKFRGFLCRRCNHILGLACDDPTWLRDLASYAEQANAR